MSMALNGKQGRTHSMRPVREDCLLQLDSLRVGRVCRLPQPVLLRRRLIGVQVLVECVCLHGYDQLICCKASAFACTHAFELPGR